MAGFVAQLSQKRGAARSQAAQEGRSTSGRASVAARPSAGGKPALAGSSLDTLAQLRNRPPERTPQSSAVTLGKRARRKYFSTAVATSLAETAKVTGSPLEKGYRNTIYCNATLLQADGKIVGSYCGNRWCMGCAAIRTARATNAYLPIVQAWTDMQFVTLTIRNVPGAQLAGTVDESLKGLTRIKDSMRKTDRVKLVALRKMECTHNAQEDTYHPHFHFAVKDRRMADLLVSRWLAMFPDRTDPKGQDIRRAQGDTMAELFKYFTKLVTKQKMMSPVALDIIFRALRGHRVYQPVGFVKPKDLEDDEAELLLDQGTDAPTRPTESIEWAWVQSLADWVDHETGECLTGYEPGEKFRRFVDSIDYASKQPPPIAGVAPIAPAPRLDVHAARALMRKRFLELERDSAPVAQARERVAKTVELVWGMGAARAKVKAAELLPQLALYD